MLDGDAAGVVASGVVAEAEAVPDALAAVVDSTAEAVDPAAVVFAAVGAVDAGDFDAGAGALAVGDFVAGTLEAGAFDAGALDVGAADEVVGRGAGVDGAGTCELGALVGSAFGRSGFTPGRGLLSSVRLSEKDQPSYPPTMAARLPAPNCENVHEPPLSACQ